MESFPFRVSSKSWRMRLTGWDIRGIPHTLHFLEQQTEPTVADIEKYVYLHGSDHITQGWEFITVEVQHFYNIKKLET